MNYQDPLESINWWTGGAGGYLTTVGPWHLPLAWPVGFIGDADRLARDQTQNEREESRNRRLRENREKKGTERRCRKRKRGSEKDLGSEEERTG